MKRLFAIDPINPLYRMQRWLEAVEVVDADTAQRICKLIPARCPFQRKIYFCDRVLLNIPPLCQLNPFYKQLMMLRFKALTYLINELDADTPTREEDCLLVVSSTRSPELSTQSIAE